MDDVRLEQLPPLQRPVMVLAFSGWNDAGEAASTTLDRLVRHWGGTLVGEIDPQPYTHFGGVRPTVALVEGHRVITWPSVRLFAVRLPGCDVIAVLGPEPALRWQQFSRQLVALAEHFDVSMTVTLGALLTDVPHTRPVQVISTSTSPTLLDRFDMRRPTYEGPTGIVGVLAEAFADADVPSASLWASVPSYAAQLPAPRSGAALVEHLGVLLGVDAPTLFGAEIAAVENRLTALLDDNDELAEYVSELESFIDGHGGDLDDFDGSAPHDGDDALSPDPAGLVAELERFLRQTNDGGGGTDSDGSDGDDNAGPASS